MKIFSKNRRVVVKIGSSIITNNGKHLDTLLIQSIAKQVVTLRKTGVEMVIVSSGAVASGKARISSLSNDIIGVQAAAIYGQPRLMFEWVKAFSDFNVEVGQALYKDEDLENAKQPLLVALKEGIVIINGNDAVYDQSIEPAIIAADNDKLAGFVAETINSDILIMLTGADGVLNSQGKVIDKIKYNEEVDLLQAKKSLQGTGGIESKLQAARDFSKLGKTAVIANGKSKNILLRILNNEQIGTWVVYN